MFDNTPTEVESRAELEHHLRNGSLAGLTVQGLDLRDPPDGFDRVDVTGAMFIACRLGSNGATAELVARGAEVVPRLNDVPYETQPPRLYHPEDLLDGFAHGGFAGMFDTVVYRHFVKHGAAMPPIREALAQRMHDHGIDNALSDTMLDWAETEAGPVVGIMGGHALLRGSPGYRMAAEIGRGLARSGCVVVTGGGPGVMEAANLGCYLSAADRSELTTAIDHLQRAPVFTDHDAYTAAAIEVRAAYGHPAGSDSAGSGPVGFSPSGARLDWAANGGLSIPTWLYGHEPANLFAGRIAKYFSNAIREDTILRLSRGGIIFAQGQAGTVQEIFQAATKAFYATDGPSGPFVFIGRRFWTETVAVTALLSTLLANSTAGDISELVHVTDDPSEAVEIIVKGPEPIAPSPVHPTS